MNKKPTKEIKQNKPNPPQKNIPQVEKLQDYPWIANWSRQIKQQIQQPIELRQQLVKHQEHQKCFHHNIIISIYCTLCRKVLCASCMYSSLTHRKHRVIPIQNANEELKEDIVTFQSKIPKITTQIQGLVSTHNTLLMHLNKKSVLLEKSIEDFYQSLFKHFKMKEKQQKARLKEFQQTTKMEILAYNRQLEKFSKFLDQKFHYYTHGFHTNEIQSIASRTILEILAQSSKFISDTTLDTEQYSFPTDIPRIKKIQEDIEIKLDEMFVQKSVSLKISARKQSREVKRVRSVSLRETSKKIQKLRQSKSKTKQIPNRITPQKIKKAS